MRNWRVLSSVLMIAMIASTWHAGSAQGSPLGGKVQGGAPPGAASVRPLVQDSLTDGRLTVTLIRNKMQTLLRVDGEARTPLLLACSMYPSSFKNAVLEGVTVIVPVHGVFEHTWTVDPQMVAGSYDVGLWRTKILREACLVSEDPWCEHQGFHLEDLVVSSSGGLDAR